MSNHPSPLAAPAARLDVDGVPVTPVPALGLAAPGAAPGSAPAWLGWAGMLAFVAVLFVPGLAFADDRYWLPLFTRYVALALFALSVDLVWGYTGLLSLGQGLFWWSLALGLGVAFVVALPVNRWLIARGSGHARAHSAHAH